MVRRRLAFMLAALLLPAAAHPQDRVLWNQRVLNAASVSGAPSSGTPRVLIVGGVLKADTSAKPERGGAW